MTSITVCFPASPGSLGIGQGGLKLMRSLSSQGWSVRGICGGPEGGLPDTVQSVGTNRLVAWLARTPLRISDAVMVTASYVPFDRRCSARLTPSDFVYAYSESSLSTLRAARALGATSVLHAATSYVPAMRAVVRAENRRVGRRGGTGSSAVLERRVLREYREADIIRAQSTLVKASLESGGIEPSKIAVVAPSVDTVRFTAHPMPALFTVGFVGAFSVRKGFHHLLAAWSSLRELDARIILHGGYGDRWGKRQLKGFLASGSAEWRQGVPESTYRDAAVIVVPSVEDGFCYVVLEAMASGRPVIVSEMVGAKDVVTDGVDGFIVPASDPTAIADRLKELHADPARLERMGRAARRAAERYTFKREGADLAAAFLSMSRRGDAR